ncbi:unnamed protein product [Lactuca virosa]|uniref:Nucleoplasmin-like domain-containing protein n=1 Tax=Lactuca virosa TaxID=75947 RepID=A0AAU9P9E9_9ASTR|nr:unnamed protein product [Lactuca virosa]
MKFWAREVKSGQQYEAKILEGFYLNITHVSLGEVDEESKEFCLVHIIVNGKKLVVAALDRMWLPSEFVNVVCFKNFHISHTLSKGSVYLYGTLEELEESPKKGV